MTTVEFRTPRELMQRVYDLREQGVSVPRIAALVGRPENTVYAWIYHPERYDPYIDQVAVERALSGDRKVFDNLTLYEADEFYDRLEARMAIEPYDRRLHHKTRGTTGNPGTRSPHWLHDLAELLGLPVDRLRRAMQRRAEAREAA